MKFVIQRLSGESVPCCQCVGVCVCVGVGVGVGVGVCMRKPNCGDMPVSENQKKNLSIITEIKFVIQTMSGESTQKEKNK